MVVALVMTMLATLCVAAQSSAAGAKAGASATPKFVAVLYHHGARTPLDGPGVNASWKDFHWVWPEAKGELTEAGVAQDFAYGKHLKRRYLDSGLVASNAMDARESALAVYASRSDRGLESAQAVLRGMFGVRDELQTVPVHGAVKDMLDGWRECPSASEMRMAWKRSTDWEAFKSKKIYIETTRRLEKEFGMKVSLNEWERLYDWVLAADASKVSGALPAKFDTKLQENIRKIGEWVTTSPFTHKMASLLGDLTGGAIVNDILTKMADAVDHPGEKTAKMVIYSAHSDNMMGVLQILGLYEALKEAPSFGSALFVELVENAQKEDTIIIRYNGKQWDLPDCPNAGDCSLHSFRNMFINYVNESFIESYWPSVCDRDLTKTCTIKEGNPPSFISFIPLWVVAGVLGGFLAAILLILVIWRWWRNRKYRPRSEIILDLEI